MPFIKIIVAFKLFFISFLVAEENLYEFFENYKSLPIGEIISLEYPLDKKTDHESFTLAKIRYFAEEMGFSILEVRPEGIFSKEEMKFFRTLKIKLKKK
jgi:hypothetical protein